MTPIHTQKKLVCNSSSTNFQSFFVIFMLLQGAHIFLPSKKSAHCFRRAKNAVFPWPQFWNFFKNMLFRAVIMVAILNYLLKVIQDCHQNYCFKLCISEETPNLWPWKYDDHNKL